MLFQISGMDFEVCVPCTCDAPLPPKTSGSASGPIDLVSSQRGHHYISLLKASKTIKKEIDEEEDVKPAIAARGSVVAPDPSNRVWKSPKAQPSVGRWWMGKEMITLPADEEEEDVKPLKCARGSAVVPDLSTRVWISPKAHPSVGR